MRKRNNIGEAGLDIALIAGAGLAVYFLVLKPGLNILGLGGNDPVITAQMSLPGSQNQFSYQFQPFITFYNDNTPVITGVSDSGFLQSVFSDLTMSSASANTNPTIQQFFIYLKSTPPNTSPWVYIDVVDLSARAEHLYSALSVSAINPLSTSDQTGGLSALAGLSDQLQIAFIANYFWWNFQTDLLTFMNGSIVKAGLTQANLVTIINNVNNLPVNPA